MWQTLKRNWKKIASLIAGVLPSISKAQFSLNNSNFRGIVVAILDITNKLIPIMIATALIVFFWGLSRFILNSGSPEERKNGQNYMLWGIIALFVLLSVRGIIAFFSGEFGFPNSTIEGVFLPSNP